jgi:GWxTD domain-containing protein
MRMFLIIGLVLLLMDQSPDIHAQTLRPKGSFILNLDYAKFKNNDSASYLEIYYNFYPRLATLAKTENQFRGYIKVFTRIRNTQDHRVIVNDRALIPIVVEDTAKTTNEFSFVTQAGYSIPFGEYMLQVVAIDSLNPSRIDSLNLPFTMASFGTGFQVSDLELCSSIKTSDQKTDLFYKNSLEVVPSPTLVFGATAHPVLFRYAEFYNLDINETYQVQSQILDGNAKVVRESSKKRKFGVQHAVDVGSMTVTSFPSGRYKMQVVLSDTLGHEFAKSSKNFYLYNPHIKTVQRAMSVYKATELAGMSADELGQEFSRMQYLTTDQEIKSFGQISSVDGRREFIATIWGEVEQGRGGKPPISRGDYLKRITDATQRYRAQGREGWKTDRGRVFVLYGEPDEIERHPSQEDTKPYEIWQYYQIENGVQFYFIDRSSFGDFILVHSTKRGEIQDDQWMRFLQ